MLLLLNACLLKGEQRYCVLSKVYSQIEKGEKGVDFIVAFARWMLLSRIKFLCTRTLYVWSVVLLVGCC